MGNTWSVAPVYNIHVLRWEIPNKLRETYLPGVLSGEE